MRAIEVRGFGGPEVLVAADVPEPVAGPGQVLVDVVAADVIYLDTMVRRGWGGDSFPVEVPYVPGGGGAGRVVAVGDGVDPGLLGRIVLARAVGGYTGGYAERFVAEIAVAVPSAVSPVHAAALLHDGATALDLVGLGEVEKGDRVLVSAAAGGAGSLLVQLAREAGAEVIAAARGARKLALARELGADHVVDYSADAWTQRVLEITDGAGVDVAFDGVGGDLGGAAFAATADGGRFVTYGTADGAFAAVDARTAERRRVHVVNALEHGGARDERALLTEALALVADGRLRPTVGATFPLEQARDAHRSLQDRQTVGKSLLLA